MSKEKKPSLVKSAVQKLAYNAQQLESDLQKKLGKTLYHQKTTAVIQEALVDASIAIFDPDEDIEFRVRETIALMNFRITGLQGREQALLVQAYDVLQEIIAFEWMPLLRALRIYERRLDLQGIPRDEYSQREAVRDLVTWYGETHVIQWFFKVLARSFGSEAEIPQFVVLASNMTPALPSDLRFRGGDNEQIGGQ